MATVAYLAERCADRRPRRGLHGSRRNRLHGGVPYEIPVAGRYWSDFDRSNPIDAAVRTGAWTPTAHALIGELGVGTATASSFAGTQGHRSSRRPRPRVRHRRQDLSRAARPLTEEVRAVKQSPAPMPA